MGLRKKRVIHMLFCVACGNGWGMATMIPMKGRWYHMLNENLKAIRKAKGLSQEELAVKVNVVRQTISKWEQGLSVPDSDLLIALSEALETPVSTLLGEPVTEAESKPDDLKAIAEKLEVINLQLAQRKKCETKSDPRDSDHTMCRHRCGLSSTYGVGQSVLKLGLQRPGNRRYRSGASYIGMVVCSDRTFDFHCRRRGSFFDAEEGVGYN